jgi:prepilin-type N-terminal cleavage/methylation domain-containing protein
MLSAYYNHSIFGGRLMKHRRVGFTLIELLIVVAIIAILAAIAVPNFLEAQIRSKVSRAKADLRSIATALESYYVDNNHYMPFTVYVRGLLGEQQIHLLTTPVAYITSIPQDVFQASKPKKSTTCPAKNYDDWYGPYPRYFLYSTDTFLLNGETGWTVRCMGPDLDFDLVGCPSDNDIVEPLNAKYDPTNGTVSNGDIVRAGGGIRFFSSND